MTTRGNRFDKLDFVQWHDINDQWIIHLISIMRPLILLSFLFLLSISKLTDLVNEKKKDFTLYIYIYKWWFQYKLVGIR